jgi:hypothetical protein
MTDIVFTTAMTIMILNIEIPEVKDISDPKWINRSMLCHPNRCNCATNAGSKDNSSLHYNAAAMSFVYSPSIFRRTPFIR